METSARSLEASGSSTAVQLRACAALTGESIALVRVEGEWTTFELRSAIDMELPFDKLVDAMILDGAVIPETQTITELGLKDDDVMQVTLKDAQPSPGTYSAETYVRFGTKYGPSFTTQYMLHVKRDRSFELEHCWTGGGTAEGRSGRQSMMLGRFSKCGKVLCDDLENKFLLHVNDDGSVILTGPIGGNRATTILLTDDNVNRYDLTAPTNPLKAMLE
mmetsp:Transcript_33062/g.61063  ORF Transcript_33062/g.61063 Transcript_33062/m.61063 type:complete len:219 (-) Transcript_33062:207-863(-)